jgi:hypothetical protein
LTRRSGGQSSRAIVHPIDLHRKKRRHATNHRELKMKRLFSFGLAVVSLWTWTDAAAAADRVDLSNLLPQMTDLSLLSEYPDPPFVTKQFSSYDRGSEAPGKESWFANGDRGFMLYDGVLAAETPYFKSSPAQGRAADGHFAAGTHVGIAPTHKRIGGYVWAYATAADGRPEANKIIQGYIASSAITMDPQGHVLAEMNGPGCVVRIWSANPKDAGKVRIYLDGAEKPVIEASLEKLLGGKWSTTLDGKETVPFPDPIACERSRGFNLYFPIAYSRHCKITIDRPDIYYHVDYRTYPAGTDVATFTWKEFARSAHSIEGVAAGLRPPIRHAGPGSNEMTRDQTVTLEPGKSVRINFNGSWAVNYLSAQVGGEASPGSTDEAWRSLVLVATFDGALQPQVWCPLGDFFGSSPGFHPYDSLPFDVGGSAAEQKMESWWYMPFEKTAVIEVRNMGKRPYQVSLREKAVQHVWSDRSMHFHAKWRAETLKSRPFSDWTYCDLKGKGVFVGDMLSLTNPVTAWWGEGDEKIFVDGESFPSWFGTGSEDYYGYAWSDPKPFQHAYHNQTLCDGPGTKGRTSVNRFHILDSIPFTTSFKFDMEFWHWTPKIDVPHAATSYWYAQPGATDDFKEPDTVTVQSVPAAPAPYRIIGGLEGENLRIVQKSGDFDASPQDMAAFGDGEWSGSSHLWVRPAKVGEWVDLELPVPVQGRYHVIVYLTKARDYGAVRFSVNGQQLGPTIDCFHADTVVSTGAIDLGSVRLQKGTATLRGEVVGTNPKSDGTRYMWGLDAVVLKPTIGTKIPRRKS